MLQELVKLVWLRISVNDDDSEKIVKEMVNLGTSNINAIRKFCFHSKFVINREVSVKLIKSILSIIKEEMECLPVTKVSKKKMKFSNEKNGNNTCD